MTSVNESVKLINRYKHLLKDYDLKDILAKAISVALTDKTGIYTVVNPYCINYVSLNIYRPFTTDIVTAKKELEYILKTYDLTLKQAQEYTRLKYIIEYMRNEKSKGKYHCPDMKAHHAVALVRYCLSGKIDPDQSQINAFLDKKDLDPQAIRFDFIYDGVTLQSFKNGRLDIGGLNNKQENRLRKVLMIRDEIRRINVKVHHKFLSEK
ncbi:MAG TPA: hypothetical protein DCG19_11230 [Cryomorphaceae bacterium]|nr:hypothetical protein [Cryomorphaceae bacterium]|tara:strand:- start:379 stop:1005 length:627 start_codon:yes stop_codon:yes gene_type:complete